jgi:hypothetical protein
MDFVPLIVLTAMIKKIVDTLKYTVSGDLNAVVTQIVAWAAGVALAFVAANSDWGDTIMVNGQSLASLNGWSLAFVGVNLASLAGFGWDTLKAIDHTNSATVPTLLAPHSRTDAPVVPVP